jgi:uncharacterized protein (TIGR03435 family)
LLTSVALAQNSLVIGPGKTNVAFAKASIRVHGLNGRPSSIFPLGPGDAYAGTGGRFLAANYDLLSYISFAYELTSAQRSALAKQLPSWAGFDTYDVDAQASNPAVTKDDMRAMMRSLLAQKFQFVMHKEMRTGTLYALRLIAAGKAGPNLKSHPADQSCSMGLPVSAGSTKAPQTSRSGTIGPCRAIGKYPVAYGAVLAGRDLPISLLVNAVSGVEDCVPVVDQTGLTGRYDFMLAYSVQTVRRDGKYAGSTGGGSIGYSAYNGAVTGNDLDDLRNLDERTPDPSDEQHEPPKLEKALQLQLGMKLVKQYGQSEVWVIDHIARLPKS